MARIANTAWCLDKSSRRNLYLLNKLLQLVPVRILTLGCYMIGLIAYAIRTHFLDCLHHVCLSLIYARIPANNLPITAQPIRNLRTPASAAMNKRGILYRAIWQLFERLFLISWENNRDCDITMPLSLKTMKGQIKVDQ